MKTIYAVRDRIANDLVGIGIYCLFIFRVDQSAVRYFADALLDLKSSLNKHPEDYELIACGDIDDTGNIRAYAPRVVITGEAFLAATTEHQPQLVKDA